MVMNKKGVADTAFLDRISHSFYLLDTSMQTRHNDGKVVP